MASQFLSLSLFIMLLSFFIILNVMSNFDPSKTRPVLESVTVAFASQIAEPELENAPSTSPQSQSGQRSADTLSQIEGLFRAELSDVAVRKNRFGTTMNIRLPRTEFENYIRVVPETLNDTQPDETLPFLDTLLSLLSAEEAGVPYHMDITLLTAENPAALKNSYPQAFVASIQKAAGYAQVLEAAGLPKKLVSSGIGVGPEGYIDLFFKVYQPYDPQQGT